MAKVIKRKTTIPTFPKKKYCRLCKTRIKDIDYKNIELLQRFITTRGKIISPRISGNCAKHQRKISRAIKRARIMALLPFVGE